MEELFSQIAAWKEEILHDAKSGANPSGDTCRGIPPSAGGGSSFARSSKEIFVKLLFFKVSSHSLFPVSHLF